MSLDHIRDQPVAVRLLRRIAATGRVPHGLLFHGPAGVGKHTTALALAKAVNCLHGDGDACGACLGCRKIAGGNHPDVRVITPSGKTRIINKDTLDFVTDLSAYRPFEGRWRVFIFEDVDRMNETAQNHFLKTLEEPPSNTLFVLCTAAPRRLLPTIRSRCQLVRFGALRPETVARFLQAEHGVSDAVAPAIAAISQGQMTRALNLVKTDKRDIVLDLARRLSLGEDPLVISEEFVAHLRAQIEQIRAEIKARAEADDADAGREDREEQKQEQAALAEAAVRGDLMEYLYLIEAWYRDALVYDATEDPHRVLNRDQIPLLEQGRKGDHAKRIQAVETAWRHIERNLSMDRVFRDLFFNLAA